MLPPCPGRAVPGHAGGLAAGAAAAKEDQCHSKESLSLTVDGLFDSEGEGRGEAPSERVVLLVTTVGLFVEGDADVSIWPSPFL